MKKYLIALLALTMAFSLTACKKQINSPTQTSSDESTSSQPEGEAGSEAESASHPETSPSVNESAPPPQTEAGTEEEAQYPVSEPLDLIYADMKDSKFTFNSGNQKWSTTLRIDAEGNFEGLYVDNDETDFEEEYPKGTRYQCSFSGHLGELTRVNDYTFKAKVEDLQLAKEADKTRKGEIIDEVRVINTEPVGFEEVEELLFYTPDAPVKDLPDDYLVWASRMTYIGESDMLGTIGIYNEKFMTGFIEIYEGNPEKSKLYNEAAYKMKNANLAARNHLFILENLLLNEAELTEASQGLYTIWDSTMNFYWNMLKQNLDDAAYQTLVAEQNKWIAEKLAALEEVEKNYKGASIAVMEQNMVAAQMTEFRCKELLEEIEDRAL